MSADELILLATITALFAVILLVLLARQHQSHRATLAQADRLSQFLLVMARANRMVLRIHEEEALLDEACKISVETGGALLACVYAKRGTLAHRTAFAGPAAELLGNVPNPLNLADPDIQNTYTAKVLRDGKRLVSNDYVLDPRAGRWRKEAVTQGIKSIAWIPLQRAGAVTAVLMLCAKDQDFFDADLLTLLDELGEDLSFALDGIDAEQARLAALKEVEAGHDRFRRVFDAAPVPMAIVSVADRRLVEVNEALSRRYRMKHDAIVGTPTASHAYGVVPEDRDLFYRILNTKGRVRNLVLRFQDIDGGLHASRSCECRAHRIPWTSLLSDHQP